MIKANELRIENIVKTPEGEIVTVNTVDEPVIEVQLRGDKMISIVKNFELEDILPIELTEEWLIKGGFEDISGDKNGIALRMMINKTDELAFWMNERFIRYQTRGSGFTRDFNKSITHVHQLQNLYYYLTGGEELEFKI